MKNINTDNGVWQASLWRGLLVVLVLQLSLITSSLAQAQQEDSYRMVVKNHQVEIQSKCVILGNVIIVAKKRILCISGKIQTNRIDYEKLKNSTFDFVYVNSLGGEVLTAIKLGRIINERRIPVFISGICLSSCANYIVPAASKVIILENSYVGFHGTPQRHEKSYSENLEKARIDRWLKPSNGKSMYNYSIEDIDHSISISKKDKQLFKEITLNEVNYFLDIGIDEAYATSFSYTRKRVLESTKVACRPSRKLYFILGPKHAHAYGIPISNSWFPKNQNDFDKLRSVIPNHSLIYDFDTHPFFIAPNHYLDANICDFTINQ